MAKRRLRRHKQMTMTRRLKSGKKPMSAEQKLERKKKADEQRAEAKKRLAKKE